MSADRVPSEESAGSYAPEGVRTYRTFAGHLPYFAPAVLVLLAVFTLHVFTHVDPVGGFTVRGILNSAITLAVLAVGQTVVVIIRGIDFSAIAILAFVNSAAVVLFERYPELSLLIVLGMVLTGAAAGAINGVLVAISDIESVVASIIMFFVWSGLALLVLSRPGGSVPRVLTGVVTQSVGPFPRALILLVLVALLWTLISRTRFGVALFAVGSDPDRSAASGVDLRRTVIGGYAIAGLFYGVAAVIYTAVSASGDPRVRFVLLAEMFAAVVIGGTRLGGGRGGALGTILGALILVLLRVVVFSLGISSYYAGVAAGFALLLAVLPHSFEFNSIRSRRHASRLRRSATSDA